LTISKVGVGNTVEHLGWSANILDAGSSNINIQMDSRSYVLTAIRPKILDHDISMAVAPMNIQRRIQP